LIPVLFCCCIRPQSPPRRRRGTANVSMRLLSRNASYTITSLLTVPSSFRPPAATTKGRPFTSNALAAHIDPRPCDNTNAVDTDSALSLGVVASHTIKSVAHNKDIVHSKKKKKKKKKKKEKRKKYRA
jgi:hypothetical protein